MIFFVFRVSIIITIDSFSLTNKSFIPVGGGDWPIAYILLYGPKICEIPIEEGEKQEESSEMSID
jgi:hypothetical protein